MWWHHKQPNLGHIYLWQGKENISKIFYKTFKNFGVFFPILKQIAKDINQSLTLQDALNILQLWQKAFQYKPHATSTQKNSQKTNKQKTPSGTNKQTSTTTKKNHKEVYLVTSGHLCEKEKVEKYFLVCTHISFLYLYQCL